MARIALTKLVLRNFRSFLGEHTIHLPSSGLVLLVGESGAGKSAILHAIAYAFGFAPYSAKALQNWDTEEPMSVEVHMETEHGQAEIIRGERLQFQLADQVIKGNAKAVEAAIDEYCGIPASLRAALTYRGQKKSGLFLSMTDSEKKEFFVDVLKLQWAEDAIDKTSKAISVLEKEEQGAISAVGIAESRLQFCKENIPELKFHDITDLEAQVAAMKVAGEELSERLKKSEAEFKRVEQEEWEAAKRLQSDIEPRVRELEDEIRRIQSTPPAFDTSKVAELQRQLTECRERRMTVSAIDAARKAEHEDAVRLEQRKLRELEMAVDCVEPVQKELALIEGQLAAMEDDKCPTCEQNWIAPTITFDERHVKIHKLKTKLLYATEIARPEMAKCRERIAELAKFEPDPRLALFNDVETVITAKLNEEKRTVAIQKAVHQSEMQGSVTKLQLEISKLRANAANDATALLRDQDRPALVLGRTVRDLGHEVNAHWKREHELSTELDRIKREDAEAFLKHQGAVGAEYMAQCHLNDRKYELDQVRSKLNAERDFHGMLKGFLNAIFDEILAEITDETNVTLGSLPNVAHMTIRFVSDYQTQKGTTKQAIVPIASFNGDERPLDSGCSGGMETSVELAVDLAVAHVVARRTGSDLAWLILDESFNGHDQATKESCLEVLARYGADKLVLIVDHGAEAKEMFTQRIHVTNNHGRSELAKETA